HGNPEATQYSGCLPPCCTDERPRCHHPRTSGRRGEGARASSLRARPGGARAGLEDLSAATLRAHVRRPAGYFTLRSGGPLLPRGAVRPARLQRSRCTVRAGRPGAGALVPRTDCQHRQYAGRTACLVRAARQRGRVASGIDTGRCHGLCASVAGHGPRFRARAPDRIDTRRRRVPRQADAQPASQAHVAHDAWSCTRGGPGRAAAVSRNRLRHLQGHGQRQRIPGDHRHTRTHARPCTVRCSPGRRGTPRRHRVRTITVAAAPGRRDHRPQCKFAGDAVLQAVARPWLKSYPTGVSAEIDPTQYHSLIELLEEAFRKYASRDAAVCMETRVSFRDVDLLSAALGAWLQSKGLARGTRVALMMPNLPQYMVAIAAVLRAGYTVVNVNPLYTPRELEHQLNDSGAEAIVVLENFAKTLEEVIAR